MNGNKIKRELYNLKLLNRYFRDYSLSIGFWSLADGLIRRLGINGLYKMTHFKRYEVCKDYLRKKYGYVIQKYQKLETYRFDNIRKDETVWRFWYQGEKNMPYPVDLCVESVKRHANEHPIVFIDSNNYEDYVTLPSSIKEKIKTGRITIAHLSDILRLALLHEHGGIWLDSTFYLTRDIPDNIEQYGFFSICAENERKWVVSKDLWSVGMMCASKNNSFIDYCWEFFQEYLENEDTIICYLLLDCIISIGYEDIPEFRQLINSIPGNNKNTFVMLDDFRNKPVNNDEFNRILDSTYIFQLTYKNHYKKEVEGRMTNFAYLIEK